MSSKTQEREVSASTDVDDFFLPAAQQTTGQPMMVIVALLGTKFEKFDDLRWQVGLHRSSGYTE